MNTDCTHDCTLCAYLESKDLSIRKSVGVQRGLNPREALAILLGLNQSSAWFFTASLPQGISRLGQNSTQSDSLFLNIWEHLQNNSSAMSQKQWSLNELAPQYLSSLFKRNSQCSTRCLRNTETDQRVPKKTSANGQKCFSFRGAKLWNSLSAESKQASSLNSFKKSVQR